MPKRSRARNIELFIVDIYLADYRIGEYASAISDADAFRQDSMRWDATIRQLEIIGEALGNILEDERLANFAPAYFRKVVNFRNAIIHGYFGIDETEVWSVIKQHLPNLIADLSELVARCELDIKKAIALETTDLERLGDKRACEYLKSINPAIRAQGDSA